MNSDSRGAAFSTQLRVLTRDSDHCVGAAGNMLLAIWRRLTTPAAMDGLRANTLDLAKQHAKGIGVLQYVCVGATPPDGKARDAIGAFLEAGEPIIKHSSIVHEGTGFGAAGVRAVMAGIYMVKRPRFPHVVFGSMGEASQWHANHQRTIGYVEPADHLTLVVRQLVTLSDR